MCYCQTWRNLNYRRKRNWSSQMRLDLWKYSPSASYCIREVHLNAVSQYDYGTIVVTVRRVNIRIPTFVGIRIYHVLCGCTELDTVYLCSTYCTKLVLITRLLCVTSLAVASRFSPERPYVPCTRERSNLSRWPVGQSRNCILANTCPDITFLYHRWNLHLSLADRINVTRNYHCYYRAVASSSPV